MIYSALAFASLAFLLNAFPSTRAGAESRHEGFSLIFMSDIYSMTGAPGRGGLARIASYVKAKKSRTARTLVIHGGDALSPSLMSTIDQGAHMIDILNMIGLDAFVPGNHEFDFGEKTFMRRMSEARFPIFAANLKNQQGSSIPGIRDFQIIEWPDLKVGLIGLTAEDSPQKSQPESLKFNPAVEEAKAIVKTIREKNVDIVIIVTHSSRGIDNRLFREAGADIILSGDDHDVSLIYDGRTAFVEAGHEGEFIVEVNVRLDIRGDGEPQKMKWIPDFKIIDVGTISEDELVKERVTQYEKALARTMNEPLAKTLVELDSRSHTLRSGEARIANLFADAIRSGTKADVALLNGGSFRGNKVYDAGSTLTKQHILQELPFLNKTIVLAITGRQLKEALEKALSGAEYDVGSFPQIAGFSIEVDIRKPAGERVVRISKDGAPLDPDSRYSMATNDFLAKGGDGYGILSALPILIGENDAQLIADYAAKYLQAISPINQTEDGRITIIR